MLVSSGLAHGYGMAGVRIGALGGPPALVRACLQVKIATVRLNTNRLGQVGAAAALLDEGWSRRGEEAIRRNLAAVKEVVSLGRLSGLWVLMRGGLFVVRRQRAGADRGALQAQGRGVPR